MNIQREAIYNKRHNALSGERLSVDLNNMFTSMVDSLVLTYKQGGDLEPFRQACISILGLDPKIDPIDFKEGTEDDIILQLEEQFFEFYDRKSTAIKDTIFPHCSECVRKSG